MKKVILVATQGFVFEGVMENKDGFAHLTDASCIRVWGTDAGLGQLAVSGWQAGTVRDFCGVVDVPMANVVAIIECKGGK